MSSRLEARRTTDEGSEDRPHVPDARDLGTDSSTHPWILGAAFFFTAQLHEPAIVHQHQH
jgi:hypothetical protein